MYRSQGSPRLRRSPRASLLLLAPLIFVAFSMLLDAPAFLLPASLLAAYLLMMRGRASSLARAQLAAEPAMISRTLILGSSQSIEIHIRNRSGRELFIRPRRLIVSPPGLECEILGAGELLPPHGDLTLQVSIAPARVGEYVLEALEVDAYDPCILYGVTLRLPLNLEVEVLPRTHLEIYRLLAGGPGHEMGEQVPRVAPSRRGLEYYGTRPYVPGDELRHIDWKATARHARLMVKEFMQGGSGSMLAILDARGAASDLTMDVMCLLLARLIYACMLADIPITISIWRERPFDEIYSFPHPEMALLKLLRELPELFRRRPLAADPEDRIPLPQLPPYPLSSLARLVAACRAEEHARLRLLLARSLAKLGRPSAVVIITDLLGSVAPIIMLRRLLGGARMLVLVPRPFWQDAEALERLARLRFSRKLAVLLAHDINVIVGEPDRMIREAVGLAVV